LHKAAKLLDHISIVDIVTLMREAKKFRLPKISGKEWEELQKKKAHARKKTVPKKKKSAVKKSVKPKSVSKKKRILNP